MAPPQSPAIQELPTIVDQKIPFRYACQQQTLFHFSGKDVYATVILGASASWQLLEVSQLAGQATNPPS